MRMKHFLPALFSGVVFGAIAQPTIQTSDFYPTVGESFSINRGVYVNPGPGGNNVTWDMSSLNSTSIAVTNATPANASFPNSTITMETVGETSMYLNLGPTSYAIEGFYNSVNSLLFTYTDPNVVYQFPLSMSTDFVDNFTCNYTTNGYDFVRSGTHSVEADGYGTLITPSGTYTDVLRLRMIQDYSDYNSTFGTYDYYAEIYVWVKAGYHNELASVSTLTSSLGNSSYGLYLEDETSGLSEESLSSISIYPNPATDIVHIDSDGASITSLRLIDLNGNTVLEEEQSVASIDIQDLPKGVYTLIVTTAEGTSAERLIK